LAKQIAIDRDKLLELFRIDYRALLLFLLSDQEGIEKGVPDFHVYTFSLMVDKDEPRVCVAIPRDHAKTTLAKIAIFYLLAYSNYSFPIYVSNTTPIAANALKDVFNFITRPDVTAIYGEPTIHVHRPGEGRYEFTWRNKRIAMVAIGAGKQVRGLNIGNQRPDLAIVDDLESAEELKTLAGYEKISDWFMGTFIKALDRRRNKIIQIGNLVNQNSILADNLSSPSWKSLRLSAFLPNGEVLWPARWSLESLKADLLEYIHHGKLGIWMAEMLNIPSNTLTQLIDPAEIHFTDRPEPNSQRLVYRCMTVDPAITQNKKHAHKASITAHGLTEDGYWVLLEDYAEIGKDPYQLYKKIMEIANRWKINVVGIEAVAYQSALLFICETEAKRAGRFNMRFVPLKTGNKSKSSRIALWAGMLKSGEYRLTPADLHIVQELIDYDVTSSHNDDDTIDCIAYLYQMKSVYGHIMKEILDPGYDEYKIVPDMANLIGA